MLSLLLVGALPLFSCISAMEAFREPALQPGTIPLRRSSPGHSTEMFFLVDLWLDFRPAIMNENGPARLNEEAAAFSYKDLVEQLRLEPVYRKEGKTARTLVRSDGLSLVLTVMQSGKSLQDHQAPGPIHVMVLEGNLEFSITDGQSYDLKPLQSVALPARRMHAATAVSDCAFLIAIGGKEKS